MAEYTCGWPRETDGRPCTQAVLEAGERCAVHDPGVTEERVARNLPAPEEREQHPGEDPVTGGEGRDPAQVPGEDPSTGSGETPPGNQLAEWERAAVADIDSSRKASALVAMSRVGTKAAAARAAKVSRSTLNAWIRNDPTFARYWDMAVKEAGDVMIEEARRRAINGVREPVFHEGQVAGFKMRYSDTLLIFLLKGALPETYRDRVDHRHSGEVRNPAVETALAKLVSNPAALAQAEALLDSVDATIELEQQDDGTYAVG